MKIIAIEPTPSPNTMKIILDEELPMGKRNNYKKKRVKVRRKLSETSLRLKASRVFIMLQIF